jgi:hypothetical protein
MPILAIWSKFESKFSGKRRLLTIVWIEINQSIVATAKNFISNESFECSPADNMWRLKTY